MFATLSAVVPVTCTVLRPVRSVVFNTALPVTVSAFVPPATPVSVTVEPVRFVLAPRVVAPPYVCVPLVLTAVVLIAVGPLVTARLDRHDPPPPPPKLTPPAPLTVSDCVPAAAPSTVL